jgi:hypothetical protein
MENGVPAGIGTTFFCNKVENTGLGLNFSGTNALQIEANVMQDHTRGLVLANNGFIGNLGSSGISSDNEWNGMYPNGSHTFADNSDASTSVIYVQPNGGFAVYDPLINPLDQINGVVFQRDNTGNFPPTRGCFAPLRKKSGVKDSLRTFNTKSIAKQVMHGKMQHMFHAADSASMLAQQILYWQLHQDSTLANDNIYTAFKDSMKNKSLGKAMNRKVAFIAAAATTNFDANVNLIHPIAERYLAGNTLSVQDTADLEKIALLCPTYDGIAVYQARSILKQMGYPMIVNQCELIQENSGTQQVIKRLSSLEEENQADFVIYPNPTSGLVNIAYTIKAGELFTFELFDVVGKKHKEIRLGEGKLHTINLEQMHQGIYFFRLLAKGEVLQSGKLIIE